MRMSELSEFCSFCRISVLLLVQPLGVRLRFWIFHLKDIIVGSLTVSPVAHHWVEFQRFNVQPVFRSLRSFTAGAFITFKTLTQLLSPGAHVVIPNFVIKFWCVIRPVFAHASTCACLWHSHFLISRWFTANAVSSPLLWNLVSLLGIVCRTEMVWLSHWRVAETVALTKPWQGDPDNRKMGDSQKQSKKVGHWKDKLSCHAVAFCVLPACHFDRLIVTESMWIAAVWCSCDLQSMSNSKWGEILGLPQKSTVGKENWFHSPKKKKMKRICMFLRAHLHTLQGNALPLHRYCRVTEV